MPAALEPVIEMIVQVEIPCWETASRVSDLVRMIDHVHSQVGGVPQGRQVISAGMEVRQPDDEGPLARSSS